MVSAFVGKVAKEARMYLALVNAFGFGRPCIFWRIRRDATQTLPIPGKFWRNLHKFRGCNNFEIHSAPMSKKSNHVVPSSSGWAVKKSGAERASRTFDTKEKAIAYGRELSKSEKSELYIHRSNGMIQNRNSYTSDSNQQKVRKN
jgi:hypothetical protein